ncbi:MAG: hypothetical protein IKU68_05535 [Oscillospiraceae bacterium]|nr:hypothetical protein [Oscillospiraceae bacterium]
MKAKLLIALLAVLLLSGCGETKTITCDGCGKTQQIKASSNMDDSWIIYCEECEPQMENLP